MKKILTLAIVILTINVQAQQQAGDLSIQFSGNYVSNKTTFNGVEDKSYSGNIYLKLGKFFTQNIEMGLKPNIFFFGEPVPINSNDPSKTENKLRANVGLGLYGTYSFLTADAKFMPYGGVEINYLPIGDYSTMNLGPYAGIKYFITERINLDANMNYLINLANSYPSFDDYVVSPTFQLNIGIGVIISKTE
jgi:hypothetical protein